MMQTVARSTDGSVSRGALLLVAALAAVGCGKSKEQRVCQHGGKLCDDSAEVAACGSQLGELRGSLGSAAYDRSLDCALEANSCPEFAGCFVGGAGAAVFDWADKFGRGVQKAVRPDRGTERRIQDDRNESRSESRIERESSTMRESHSERRTIRRDVEPTGDPSLLAGCKTFTGSARSARWDGCTDRVRRELRCKAFADELRCECLEDGVEVWAFAAEEPPLDERDGATRVAAANCRRGFGN